MKAKIILLVGVVALVTLSFTFAQVSESSTTKTAVVNNTTAGSEPVGGFAAMEITK